MQNILSIHFILLFFFSAFVPTSNCQETEPGHTIGIFDLLSQDEIVEIILETNMDSLMDRKKKDIYTKGRLTFERAKKQTMSLPVNIRCRGKYRRMKCSFPPLKLKFKKSDLAAHNLNDFNELKLVTHCLDEKDMSKELILREYLTYKLYNELTPHSFRVQLVKVTYLNTGKKLKKIKGWGILIEDEEDLAERMGGQKIDRMGITEDSLDVFQECVASMFQYMVGNADYSYMMNRNVQFVLMPQGKYYATPYDFDYCGLVSAPYAKADPSLGQKSVKDRVYLGHARSMEEMAPAFKLFLSKKDTIIETVKNFPQMGDKSKQEILEYLDEFFVLLKTEGSAAEAIFSKK